MTFEQWAGPEPDDSAPLASWHLYREQKRTWMAAKKDMRELSAEIVDHPGVRTQHVKKIRVLPIE